MCMYDMKIVFSTGIGKSLAWKLASQGLNIVLVSLPEALLEATADELRSAFPDIQVIVVRVLPTVGHACDSDLGVLIVGQSK